MPANIQKEDTKLSALAPELYLGNADYKSEVAD